ncbi:AzlD family protein [Halopseudomonas pachastrellae]|uniref:AzlD family protein n=1 Tax=Halopseudomonas pachastrellae TaxID=254161 RepID=UPI003D7F0A3A
MSIDSSGGGAVLLIGLMMAIALATRLGGVFILSVTPISHRMKRFIDSMSSSVLIALVAPLLITGDMGTRLALLVAATLMLIARNSLLSIAGGVITAAGVRLL